MKSKLKKIVLPILIIMIINSIFNKVEAVNNTSNNNSNNISTTSIAGTSNANLANLGLKKYDFSGFKPEVTSYNTIIPENMEEVEVYAKTQDSKATYTVTGNTNLKKGDNKVIITVTASDGKTKKEYYINVKRRGVPDKEEEEKTEITQENQENQESQEQTTSFGTILSEPHTEYGWYIVFSTLAIVTILLIVFIIIDDYKPEKNNKVDSEEEVKQPEKNIAKVKERTSNYDPQATKILNLDEIKHMKYKPEIKGKHSK